MGNLLFLAGHARLPQGMAARSMYETLTITVEIDRKYGVIVDASCTLATEHGRDFIGKLLKGISLKDGIDEPVRILQENYKGKGANALVAAMKDLYSHYEQMTEK